MLEEDWVLGQGLGLSILLIGGNSIQLLVNQLLLVLLLQLKLLRLAFEDLNSLLVLFELLDLVTVITTHFPPSGALFLQLRL